MKSCEFKTSEASTKSWFRTNRLIDKFLNILDLNKFRIKNTEFSNYAEKTYGVKGRLFYEERGGKKALPNTTMFHQIDAAKGNWYKENEYLRDRKFQKLTEEEKNQTIAEAAKKAGSVNALHDLAARLADRIGVNVEFENNRNVDYKGYNKGNVSVINEAYADTSTVVHEILAHPIIGAIKNKYKTSTFEADEDTPFGGTLKEEDGYSELYQNLLKELETGTGKEVFERVKRGYIEKSSNELLKTIESFNSPYAKIGNNLYAYYDFRTNKRIEYKDFEKDTIRQKLEKEKIYYTLEEQQEEAIVELLGMYTANKLDAIKDKGLIALLKQLLKEMTAYLRSLFNSKEIEIEKLDASMTLDDLANLLAYTNSKIILPEAEVIYTTPDNMKFKTYQEASNHISQLAKSVEDVDLSDVSINRKLSKEDLEKISELELQKKELKNYFNSKKYQQDKDFELYKLNQQLNELKNKKVEFYSQEPFLNLEDKKKYGFDDFDYIRVESTYGRGNEYHKDILGENYEGYYIHGYNTATGKPKKKILPITKKQAEEIWSKDESSKYEVGDRQEIFRLEDKIRYLQTDEKVKYDIQSLEEEIQNIKLGQNTIQNFIEKNKEYEQSKDIIEEWKRVNNIVYNPEEVYSRGQEFVSVVGAYSDFDVNLMMQNLLSHIEDNEKAGGKFAISAFTKPIDKQIGHLEGGGGKIKFKLYPQSSDILWAANIDVYSGSVWDASEKVNKDKKSELLGVSYTKYPALNNVNAVQPNLASIIDDLAHHHNELGIVLTGNNFRLEYDEDIPYTTKKIIDGINKILDQKYGKLVKPEIKQKEFGTKYMAKEESAYGDFKTIIFNTEKEALDYKKSMEQHDDVAVKISKQVGIQPTQTNETLKESIDSVKDRIQTEDYDINSIEKIILDAIKDGISFEVWYKNIDNIILKEYQESKEYYNNLFNNLKNKNKEYTSQALINTKIAKLKEVAKKYPRSLIRSEVKQRNINTDFINYQKNQGQPIQEIEDLFFDDYFGNTQEIIENTENFGGDENITKECLIG